MDSVLGLPGCVSSGGGFEAGLVDTEDISPLLRPSWFNRGFAARGLGRLRLLLLLLALALLGFNGRKGTRKGGRGSGEGMGRKLDTADAGADSALALEVLVSPGEHHDSPPPLVEKAAFVGEESQLCSLVDEAREGGGAGRLMVLGEDQWLRDSSTDESVGVGAESQPVDNGDVGRGSS